MLAYQRSDFLKWTKDGGKRLERSEFEVGCSRPPNGPQRTYQRNETGNIGRSPIKEKVRDSDRMKGGR